MKKVWNQFIAMSRPTIGLLIAAVLVTGLMLFRLSSITPGIAEPELQTYQSAASIGAIFENTVNAPYKLAVFVATNISDSVFALRLVGAIGGVLTVGVFFLFVRKLMSPLIAIAITIMFASTSMLLHSARLASPELMLLVLLPVVAVGFLLRFHKNNDLVWILAAFVVSLSLYVPGMVIFVLLAAVFQFRHVRKSFEQLKPLTIIIASILFSLILAPIVINLIREPSIWRDFLGVPAELPSITEFGKNLLKSVSAIFVFTSLDPIRHVGRQPILDVFATTLFLYGFITLIKQYKLDRFWMILGLIGSGLLWSSLSTFQANLIILLPFLYILAGIGMQRLLNQWLDIFPKNPIAKSIGYFLLFGTVLLTVNLHVQRYFNAWPNADKTKQVFMEEIPR